VALLLPVFSVLAGLWFFRMAFSDRVKQYPAPWLGRLASVGLAFGMLAVALSASATIAFGGELDSDWTRRLVYGLSGTFIAFAGVTTGLYVFAQAPVAYQLKHPRHPSEFGVKGTAAMGRASGIMLVGLGIAAIIVTAYLVALAPGQ
jgi:hypothetical protein